MNVVTENNDLSLRLTEQYNSLREYLKESGAPLMNNHRPKAFRDFVAQGIPTRKVENYKYTNLQPAFASDFDFPIRKSTDDYQLEETFKCDVPQLNTHVVTMRNGWFYAERNEVVELPEGVILDSIDNVARTRPELVEKFYGKLADTSADAMVALNTAFAQDGYFLYVPKNVVVEQPLQIINLLQAPKDTYVTQRNLIVVEEGAEVKLILCDHTLNLKNYFFNNATEAFIGSNASLDYYTVQNQHNKSTAVNSVFVHQEQDSHLTSNIVALHGGLIRNNLKVELDGQNCEANMFGLSFLDRKQHVDNFTQIVHGQPHCESNQLYKNVLDDESTGAFSGRIHVKRDAQKTNAFQRNNNLLLTDKSQMQTKPQLIIEADDVKCSHGATIGQIDEEALFYLRTRGIEEKQARLIMMNAFSYEVVKTIKVEPLRDRISELIERRLNGDVGRCHECAYQCEC